MIHMLICNCVLMCCRYYSQQPAFFRLLNLLANEIVTKTRDIVGSDLLADPLMVCFSFLYNLDNLNDCVKMSLTHFSGNCTRIT